MRALLLLVGLQRGAQVALALRREVRNRRGRALAVQAVAALALALGEDLAGRNVAGGLRGSLGFLGGLLALGAAEQGGGRDSKR